MTVGVEQVIFMADREKEKVLCSFLASEIRDRVFYELGSSKKGKAH